MRVADIKKKTMGGEGVSRYLFILSYPSQDNAMSNTMGGDGMPDAEVHIWLSLP